MSDPGPYSKVSQGENDTYESNDDNKDDDDDYDGAPLEGQMMLVKGEEDMLVVGGRTQERIPSPIASIPL